MFREMLQLARPKLDLFLQALLIVAGHVSRFRKFLSHAVERPAQGVEFLEAAAGNPYVDFSVGYLFRGPDHPAHREHDATHSPYGNRQDDGENHGCYPSHQASITILKGSGGGDDRIDDR